MWRLIIIALISVTIAFAFVGCEGKKEEPKTTAKEVTPPPPPPPPPPQPKPFDPVGKWTGTLDSKPWTIDITKDAKDPAKLIAKGYTDIKVDGDKITFMAKKVEYTGTWDGLKENLTLNWKEKTKDMSVVLTKEAVPTTTTTTTTTKTTTEPVKKEEPKKAGK